jgi:imidazolonepropionase-like amidohydrolase
MLDAQRPGTSPAPGEEARARWSADDIRPVVDEAHARGAKVAAHSTDLVGARAAVDAGIDCIEHGFFLDADIARAMAERGTFLVSTLAVLKSFAAFGTTTRIERFVGTEGRRWLEETRETAPRAFASRTRLAFGSPPEPTSAEDPRGPTTWRGRWNPSSRPDSNRVRRSPPPRVGGASCSTKRTPE